MKMNGRAFNGYNLKGGVYKYPEDLDKFLSEDQSGEEFICQ